MLMNCLAVGCGGFVGSILRYLCSLAEFGTKALPIATLGINIIGSFAIMFFTGFFTRVVPIDEHMMLFLRVGLCGGFTTFSTFSAETLGLFEQGNTLAAVSYVVASCVLCIGAAFLGEAASLALSK